MFIPSADKEPISVPKGVFYVAFKHPPEVVVVAEFKLQRCSLFQLRIVGFANTNPTGGKNGMRYLVRVEGEFFII